MQRGEKSLFKNLLETQLMTQELSFKAILFDMDGTMINNMMIHHYAWQRKLASLGMELTIEEVMSKVHGVNYEIIKRLFGNRFTDKEIHQIAWDKEAEYRTIYADKIKLIPGLANFLAQIKDLNIPVGIGTAAPKENADFVLDKLNIRDHFSALVYADMVKKGKPNPEVFEQVAQQLNIPLEDCLIFEDSPTGAKAAQNGNCNAVIVTTTHNPDEFKNISSVKGFIEDYTSCKLNPSAAKDVFTLSF